MRESELRQLARRYDDHLAESGVGDLESSSKKFESMPGMAGKQIAQKWVRMSRQQSYAAL
jgi:hypothetical protein